MTAPHEERRGTLSVHLTCKDVPAAVRHYRETLGFTLKESWPNADAPLWASLDFHGQTVMLGADMGGEPCEGEGPGEAAFRREFSEDFRRQPGGAGVIVYVETPDVDAHHAAISGRGAHVTGAPKDQFYGIRDFGTRDLDGYRLVFFSPITMSSCQSCGMPLAGAQPGQMYCQYCTDDAGRLKSYEEVFEGTVRGYFMGMQQMERAAAEVAAREHLAGMPAWKFAGKA